MVDPQKTTIKVIACSAGMTPSDVATWTYSYFIQTPNLLPATGTYNDYVVSTVENSPSNTINPDTDFFCYTLDGTTPTCTASGCGFGHLWLGHLQCAYHAISHREDGRV
jgi:hypothetical protein